MAVSTFFDVDRRVGVSKGGGGMKAGNGLRLRIVGALVAIPVTAIQVLNQEVGSPRLDQR
jgi:hypothetical protein